jgi:hypothetical protein
MTFRQQGRAQAVMRALLDCPGLDRPSSQRDRLWLVVRDEVCTRTSAQVVPLGSTAAVTVTEDHATAELICAMEWLFKHETKARGLPPDALYSHLRSAATRRDRGSARAAQTDALRGMTGVGPGDAVQWVSRDPMEAW